MSESSKVESFLSAVAAAVGALPAQETHALAVAAKNVRRAIETGTPVSEAEWLEGFPDEQIRSLARRMLSEVSITELDFAATMCQGPEPPPEQVTQTMAMSPAAVQRKWHALLASIPDEGLPADDGGGVVDGMELGRLILQVSQAKSRINLARLPSADGFRERFLEAARDAQRLGLIDGLPDGL